MNRARKLINKLKTITEVIKSKNKSADISKDTELYTDDMDMAPEEPKKVPPVDDEEEDSEEGEEEEVTDDEEDEEPEEESRETKKYKSRSESLLESVSDLGVIPSPLIPSLIICPSCEYRARRMGKICPECGYKLN